MYRRALRNLDVPFENDRCRLECVESRDVAGREFDDAAQRYGVRLTSFAYGALLALCRFERNEARAMHWARRYIDDERCAWSEVPLRKLKFLLAPRAFKAFTAAHAAKIAKRRRKAQK